ncbi:MAG: dienelactone hydrolase family protein [Acidobacteriota bacterium]
MRPIAALSILILLITPAFAWQATDPHAGHAQAAAATQPAAGPVDEKLPPAEADAKAALEKSPRHGEWADIKVPGSDQAVRTWVVYPERKDKAGVVLVIHEIFGLSDWIRGVADQLAEDGFIAVAPDLISGKGPGGGNTDSVTSRDDVVKLVRGLTPEEVLARLNAVRDYAIHLPAANGKSATVGYCWGGSASFNYAVAQPALNAAVVYYGSAPAVEKLASVKAPVLGLYGENDQRVNATIEATGVEMKRLGKSYEPRIFTGAGHGFLRAQGGQEGANLKATQQAWPEMLIFLRKHLK